MSVYIGFHYGDTSNINHTLYVLGSFRVLGDRDLGFRVQGYGSGQGLYVVYMGSLFSRL